MRLISIFILSLFSFGNLLGQSYIDSVYAEVEKATNDSVKFELLYSLAGHYSKEYGPDSLLAHSFRIHRFAEERNFTSGITRGLGLIAYCYSAKSMYKEAIEYQKKALQIQKSVNDKEGATTSLNNIAWIYKEQGEYEKALSTFFDVLRMAEGVENKRIIPICLDNIGHIYKRTNNEDKALEYYLKALEINIKRGEKKLIARGYNNAAIMYRRKGETQKALDYYKKSLLTDEDIGNKKEQAVTLGNIGALYFSEKKYSKALEYINKSKLIDEELNNIPGIITSLNRLGRINTALGKGAEGVAYARKALLLAQKIGHKEKINTSYDVLRLSFAQQNKFDSAYVYYTLYGASKDSLFNSDKSKQLEELTAKYETEKKDKRIELLEKEKELKEAQVEKAKLEQNLLVGGFSILFILLCVIVIAYRQRVKSRQLLQAKNEEIKKQRARISGQEVERERISRELHDGLGGTLAAIKMNLTSVSSNDNGKLSSIITNVEDAYKEVRNISHDLLPFELKNTQLTTAIQDYLNKFKDGSKLAVSFDYFPEKDLNELSYAVQSDIYRIIQELVNNAIKHASATKISVALSIENGEVDLIVEDNGAGFDVDKHRKGIGLTNIYSRVNLFEGNVQIDSQIGRGSAFHIQFAIKKSNRDKFST